VDGSDARISLAFQIRARPTAILDPSFVPVGLRRVALAPVGTTVGALMADFGHSHTSVVGLGDDSDSRTAKQEAPRHSTGHPVEPAPKRQRAAASQAPSEVLTRKFVNLIVKGQDGEAIHFKIIETTPLKKVMDAYCAKRQVDAGSIAFLWGNPRHPRGGKRLSPTETPLQLGMEDGDEIDAMLHQVGD
jgi:small ubiquitin-related modifier